MKKLKIIAIAIFIVNSFWGCEKDDICEAGTPTTPRMIVEFYDNNNPSVKKAVTNLKIKAAGELNGMVFSTATDGSQYWFNGTRLEIPLKTTTDETDYSLILNEGNILPSLINQDLIEINYTREDQYISRACGFKTVFTILDNPNGIIKTLDINNWIKEITIQKYKILNEDEVHVKIFF